ncbi:MAG: hypothetical protein AAF203_03550, partial [Pseudomonadota bacterium]
ILEKAPGKIRANMKVNSQLPSFEGHFPGRPILPAVSIVDISLYLMSFLPTEISHSKLQLKRSKFMAMVKPEQEVSISAESEDGESWKILWLDQADQTKLAQIQLLI